MPGHPPRDWIQRKWSNPALFTSYRDPPASHYRTRSTSRTRQIESRSRSPRRSGAPSPERVSFRHLSSQRFESASPHNDTRQPSAHSSRQPSIAETRRPSEASTSHAHRSEGGHCYGSSIWSSQHGMGGGSGWSSFASTAAVHERNQQNAPHLYGDDELPEYWTASEHRREPHQPPSYSSYRESVRQEGSMPPPYSSASSRRQGSESPAQFPPTRRSFDYYSRGTVAGRNHYIDKWRRGE